MFDIGFTEIIIICIVALVVVGPSRMPEAIRTCAKWLGRAKRMLSNVRRDLENEIGIDEIRQDLRNEQIMSELKAEKLEEEHLLKQQRQQQKPSNAYLDNASQNAAADTPQDSTQNKNPDVIAPANTAAMPNNPSPKNIEKPSSDND